MSRSFNDIKKITVPPTVPTKFNGRSRSQSTPFIMTGDGSEEGTELSAAITSMGPEAVVVTAAPVVEAGGSFDLGTSGTTASQPADKPKGKACGVCNDHEARYKCSRCQLP
jgi:hypothetical protein